MKRTTKEVHGQLLGKDNREPLVDALIFITLIEGLAPNDRAKYEVTISVDGYDPDLYKKIHFLKLSDNLIGEISVSIIGIPSKHQTRFKVNLQDTIWNNLEWFQSI
jgi:hypothetical protein